MPQAPDPIIPFGKYKGQYAHAADTAYLDWLIGQDWVNPQLRRQIEDHLKTRADWKSLDSDSD